MTDRNRKDGSREPRGPIERSGREKSNIISSLTIPSDIILCFETDIYSKHRHQQNRM